MEGKLKLLVSISYYVSYMANSSKKMVLNDFSDDAELTPPIYRSGHCSAINMLHHHSRI